eukprot:s2279_g4.t1
MILVGPIPHFPQSCDPAHPAKQHAMNTSALEGAWHVEFLEQNALQRQKRLRSRALLSLALLAEPMERQWREIYLDVAWSAWQQVIGDEKRQREMPKAQQMYEKVLRDTHEAMGLNCLTMWSSKAAVLPWHLSTREAKSLLEKALPSVSVEDLEILMDTLPVDADGHLSFIQLMSWLYPSDESSIDTEEWKVRRRQHSSWASRGRSLLVLSTIAEPFQHFWREVFLDLAWSAWALAVATSRRQRTLPEAQAEFESEANRISALCRDQVSLEDVASSALHNILARIEIARMLEAGVPVAELISEINSGREGDEPLAASSSHTVSQSPPAEELHPLVRGDKPSPGRARQSSEKGSEKSRPMRPSSPASRSVAGQSKEAPAWARGSAISPMTFQRKPAAPPPSEPRAHSVDSRLGSWEDASEGYEASIADSNAIAMEEMVASGVLSEFKKRAEKPVASEEAVPAKDPYIPRALPTRTRPLEMQKLEQYRVLTRSLFEEMIILEVPMDLIADITTDGTHIDDSVFTLLTDPKSPGTGLRYARLLKRFLNANAVAEAQESGTRVKVFGHEFMLAVGFLDYLEKLVLDDSRDLQTRVACGKLRLCTQASIRHSDLAGTAMRDVEWCRLVGGTEVLGLRAKASFTKSGPRPWAAALLGVMPDNDGWLTTLVSLLLKMHGPGWKEHSFVGCAANKAGGFDLIPPLIDEDVGTVKRALKLDLDAGKTVPLNHQEVGALRWHSCKSTLPTYMTHFGVTTRTVRFQGAWRKASQAMPDLYLRESQTIVMKGQMEAETPSGRRDVRRSAAPSILELCEEFRGEGASDAEELASTTLMETKLMDEAAEGAPAPEVLTSLNEMVESEDSDDSDADPKEKDMDLYPFFIQLASGNGKIHKPGGPINEEPACRSQGKRFSNLSLTEDWGSSYSLCTKCFGGVKGNPGCILLCDYVEVDGEGTRVRCGRRCDVGAVSGHKRPDEPGFEGARSFKVQAPHKSPSEEGSCRVVEPWCMADTKSSVAFARAAASFEVHESDFLVLTHDRVTNFEAMAYRFPGSSDFEEYLRRSMRTRAAYRGEEDSEIQVFPRPQVLEWEDYKSSEDVGCLRKLWGLPSANWKGWLVMMASRRRRSRWRPLKSWRTALSRLECLSQSRTARDRPYILCQKCRESLA